MLNAGWKVHTSMKHESCEWKVHTSTVDPRYNECGGQSKSNEFERIRYSQDNRGSDRAGSRGDRWSGYFIFLDSLTQIQVYFQHLLKISDDFLLLWRCNMSSLKFSFCIVQMLWRHFLQNFLSYRDFITLHSLLSIKQSHL